MQEALAMHSTSEDEYVKERHNKVILRGKVYLFMLGSIRACAERRKTADRKQKEEAGAKEERTEEEHHVHLL